MQRGSSSQDDRRGVDPVDVWVSGLAPTEPAFTPYDEQHMATYMALLLAQSSDLAAAEIGRTILNIDAEREPARYEQALRSHLGRAHWLAANPWCMHEQISVARLENTVP